MFEAYDAAFLAEHLLPRRAFAPYPRYEDRGTWEALAPEAKALALARGEAALKEPWPLLLASRYADFVRNGNRSRYEADYFERRARLIDLLLAECVEGKGRFLDAIMDGAWLICEETAWTLPAHDMHDNFIQDPLPDPADSPRDLFACETGALMATLYDLLGERLERLSRRLANRVREEVLRRIVRPALRTYSFWMGYSPTDVTLNNWAPWCSSNTLLAALLLGETESDRRAYAAQVLGTLEKFLALYGEDGGCDEGAAYWGHAAASVYDCLALLYKATGGKLNALGEEKIRAMGLYLPKMHVAGPWFVNFADCVPNPVPAADAVYRFGRDVGAARMMALAAQVRQGPDYAPYRGSSVMNALEQLFVHGELATCSVRTTPAAVDFFRDIEVAVARKGGFTLAAKGGHNAESHNHNDVGSFSLYHGGEPALIDAGTLTYTRKTFSPQRYEIWTMDSSYHNLPDFGGARQRPGRQYASGGVSVEAGDPFCFTVEAAPAWAEGVTRYTRTLTLTGRTLTGKETFALPRPETVTLHFLLRDAPEWLGDGWRIPCAGGDLKLTVEKKPAAWSVDTLWVGDAKMEAAWDREALVRLNILLPETVADEYTWRVEKL